MPATLAPDTGEVIDTVGGPEVTANGYANPTPPFHSELSSTADRARFHTPTSSIKPLKRLLVPEYPPTSRVPAELSVDVLAVVPFDAPLMYSVVVCVPGSSTSAH